MKGQWAGQTGSFVSGLVSGENKHKATPYIGDTLDLCWDLPGEARVLLLLPLQESQPESLRGLVHQVPDAGQLRGLAAACTQGHFVHLNIGESEAGMVSAMGVEELTQELWLQVLCSESTGGVETQFVG